MGGGYAPGEGAKGIRPSQSMSLVPLRHMYDCALRCGIPMVAEFPAESKADFEADPTMCAAYDSYLKVVGSFASLGDGMNKHMALYYAWRFRSINRKRKGERRKPNSSKLMTASSGNMKPRLPRSQRSEAKEMLAKLTVNALTEVQVMNASANDGGVPKKPCATNDASVERARENYDAAHEERLKAKARKDGLPNMNRFQTLLDMYDQRLLADVAAIRQPCPAPVAVRKWKTCDRITRR